MMIIEDHTVEMLNGDTPLSIHLSLNSDNLHVKNLPLNDTTSPVGALGSPL